VAANKPLRERLVQRSPVHVIIPPPVLCTDNAAMIACCGYHHLQRGHTSGLDLDVQPNWKMTAA
jgi:N6-L-threonylcarbamoyladenine synthase